MAKKHEQLENEIEIRDEIRELEQFYNTGKVDNLFANIDAKKKEIINEMVEYREKHTVPTKWDDEGNPISYKINLNPLVIVNYFFKPIVPITSQEPLYNAEKLGMVFDYYCDILASVNDEIGYFPSSLTSFCKLAGITLNTLRSYRNSTDYNMRVVAAKIYDQIGDENITMSQMGYAKERTTIFKMKSQNEMVEKQQPNVNININTEQPDLDRINERLSKYKQFANKKGKK